MPNLRMERCRPGLDRGGNYRVRCGCRAEGCRATIEIAATDYTALRLSERWSIVLAGHELEGREQPLLVTAGYTIVGRL